MRRELNIVSVQIIKSATLIKRSKKGASTFKENENEKELKSYVFPASAIAYTYFRKLERTVRESSQKPIGRLALPYLFVRKRDKAIKVAWQSLDQILKIPRIGELWGWQKR